MSHAEAHYWRWLENLRLTSKERELLEPILSVPDIVLLDLFESCLLTVDTPRAEIGPRILPIILQQLVIHLADDIADGDCRAFENPQKEGVTALCILSNWVGLSLSDSPYSKAHCGTFQKKLQQVGFGQIRELGTLSWNLQASKYVADAINSSLYQAYFELIFSHRLSSENACVIGRAFGVANHIAIDIESKDIRFQSLSLSEQQQLRRWALDCVATLLEQTSLELPAIRNYARSLLHTLV